MKKRLIMVISMICVFMLSCALAFGCKSTGTTVSSIEWVTQPASSYTVGTTPSISFSFKIKYSDNTEQQIDYSGNADASSQVKDSAEKLLGTVSFNGTFATTTAGNFTAKLTFTPDASAGIGTKSFTLSFEYSVVAAEKTKLEKASGQNYYEVGDAVDFALIMTGSQGLSETNEYRLTADIDLSTISKAYQEKIKTTKFVGTIDGGKYNSGVYSGNNYKLLNYVADSTNAEFQPGLFGVLGNATFKNIDVVNFKLQNASASYAALFAIGLNKNVHTAADCKVSIAFDNVDMYACKMLSGKNSGLYLGNINVWTDVTFKGCDGDKDCVVSCSDYGAGAFVGPIRNYLKDNGTSVAYSETQYNATNNKYQFDACNYAGTIAGTSRNGVFYSNITDDTDAGNYVAHYMKARNCNFTGSMYVLSSTQPNGASSSARLFEQPLTSGAKTNNLINCLEKSATYYMPENGKTLTTQSNGKKLDTTYSGFIALSDIVGIDSRISATIGAVTVGISGNHFSVTKYLLNNVEASYYVLSNTIWSGTSGVVFSEVIVANGSSTYTSKMVKLTDVYAGMLAANDSTLKTNLLSGKAVVTMYPENPTVSGPVGYRVCAYNAAGIPIGTSADGYYSDGVTFHNYTAA